MNEWGADGQVGVRVDSPSAVPIPLEVDDSLVHHKRVKNQRTGNGPCALVPPLAFWGIYSHKVRHASLYLLIVRSTTAGGRLTPCCLSKLIDTR
jgi:hypothetical protein